VCLDRPIDLMSVRQGNIEYIRAYSSIFKVFSKNIQRICLIHPKLKGLMDMCVCSSGLLWTSNMTTLHHGSEGGCGSWFVDKL
jgi:hypothetical protein